MPLHSMLCSTAAPEKPPLGRVFFSDPPLPSRGGSSTEAGLRLALAPSRCAKATCYFSCVTKNHSNTHKYLSYPKLRFRRIIGDQNQPLAWNLPQLGRGSSLVCLGCVRTASVAIFLFTPFSDPAHVAHFGTKA